MYAVYNINKEKLKNKFNECVVGVECVDVLDDALEHGLVNSNNCVFALTINSIMNRLSEYLTTEKSNKLLIVRKMNGIWLAHL